MLSRKRLAFACKQLRPKRDGWVFGITWRDKERQWGSIPTGSLASCAIARPAQWHLAAFLPCWGVAVLLHGEGDSSFWWFPGIIWSQGSCLCLQQDLTGWGDLRLDCFSCNFFFFISQVPVDLHPSRILSCGFPEGFCHCSRPQNRRLTFDHHLSYSQPSCSSWWLLSPPYQPFCNSSKPLTVSLSISPLSCVLHFHIFSLDPTIMLTASIYLQDPKPFISRLKLLAWILVYQLLIFPLMDFFPFRKHLLTISAMSVPTLSKADVILALRSSPNLAFPAIC